MSKEDLHNWYESEGYEALRNFMLHKGGFLTEFSSQDLRTLEAMLPDGHSFYLELAEATVLQNSTWVLRPKEDPSIAATCVPYMVGRLLGAQSKQNKNDRFTLVHWSYEEYFWHLVQFCESVPSIGARVYQKQWDHSSPVSVQTGPIDKMREWVKTRETSCKEPLGVDYPRHILKYWPGDPRKEAVLYAKNLDGSLREEQSGPVALMRMYAAADQGTTFAKTKLEAFLDPARPFTLSATERSLPGLPTIRLGLDRGTSLI